VSESSRGWLYRPNNRLNILTLFSDKFCVIIILLSLENTYYITCKQYYSQRDDSLVCSQKTVLSDKPDWAMCRFVFFSRFTTIIANYNVLDFLEALRNGAHMYLLITFQS
jgi:hypothetical protein